MGYGRMMSDDASSETTVFKPGSLVSPFSSLLSSLCRMYIVSTVRFGCKVSLSELVEVQRIRESWKTIRGDEA